MTLSIYTYVCKVKGVEGKIGKRDRKGLEKRLITVKAGRREEEYKKGNKLRGNGL